MDLASKLEGFVLPLQTFFTPTEAFWQALRDLKLDQQGLRLVDCGTGSGLVPHLARERGFNMIGIDLVRREGTPYPVEIADACAFSWTPSHIVLVCRPCHSNQFAPTLFTKARMAGVRSFYVGLTHNVRRDTVDRPRLVAKDVGEEGESMYEIPRHSKGSFR